MLDRVVQDAISVIGRLGSSAAACAYLFLALIVGTILIVTRVPTQTLAKLRPWWWLVTIEFVIGVAVVLVVYVRSTRPPPLGKGAQLRMTVCGFTGEADGAALQYGLLGELSLLLDSMGLASFVEVGVATKDRPANVREAAEIARRTGSALIVWGETGTGGVVYPHVGVLDHDGLSASPVPYPSSVSVRPDHESSDGPYTQLALAVIEGAIPGLNVKSPTISPSGQAALPPPKQTGMAWLGAFPGCPSWARPTPRHVLSRHTQPVTVRVGGEAARSRATLTYHREAFPITYVALARNNSPEKPLANVAVRVPIPPRFTYLTGSLSVNGRSVPDDWKQATIEPDGVTARLGTLFPRERMLVTFSVHL